MKRRGEDPELREAMRRCVADLKPAEFLGTVEVGDRTWHVYVHRLRPGAFDRLRKRTGQTCEDAITVAVRVAEEGGERFAEVGSFLPGALTLAEVSAELHEAQA